MDAMQSNQVNSLQGKFNTLLNPSQAPTSPLKSPPLTANKDAMQKTQWNVKVLVLVSAVVGFLVYRFTQDSSWLNLLLFGPTKAPKRSTKESTGKSPPTVTEHEDTDDVEVVDLDEYTQQELDDPNFQVLSV